MKAEPQALAWRAYAVFIFYLLAVHRTLSQIAHPTFVEWLITPIVLLATLGLVIWAFGWRLGPNVFWKIVAVLFGATVLADLYPSIASYLRGDAGRWSWEWTGAILLAIPVYSPVCIALFRAGRRTATECPFVSEPITSEKQDARLARLKARASN